MTMAILVKGILLWITIICVILFVIGIVEYIVFGALWLILCVALVFACADIITFKEFCQLTGYNYFNNKLNKLKQD